MAKKDKNAPAEAAELPVTPEASSPEDTALALLQDQIEGLQSLLRDAEKRENTLRNELEESKSKYAQLQASPDKMTVPTTIDVDFPLVYNGKVHKVVLIDRASEGSQALKRSLVNDDDIVFFAREVK